MILSSLRLTWAPAPSGLTVEPYRLAPEHPGTTHSGTGDFKLRNPSYSTLQQ